MSSSSSSSSVADETLHSTQAIDISSDESDNEQSDSGTASSTTTTARARPVGFSYDGTIRYLKPCRTLQSFETLNRIDEGTYGEVCMCATTTTTTAIAIVWFAVATAMCFDSTLEIHTSMSWSRDRYQSELEIERQARWLR
jgi:hypothetical protein